MPWPRRASTISATDLNDLKTILTDAAALHIPGYVQTLACDVIDGNAANANFQGQTLEQPVGRLPEQPIDHAGR